MRISEFSWWFGSRTRCSAKRCAADPGPSRTVTVPGLQRITSLRFVLRCARDTRDTGVRVTTLMSLRQVTEIAPRPDVGALLLKAGLDLERLHLLERVDVDLQAGIAIVIVHAHVNIGIHAHHLAVDQELPGLARAFQVERGRRLQVFEQPTDRARVLFEELILPDQ